MPDNRTAGWRKKIHGKAKELPSPRAELAPPRTEPRSAQKELPSTKQGDDTAASEDVNERRRHHGWRKTIQASRPGTPSSGAPTTAVAEGAADAPSERAETPAPAPRRNSKPKLARYTALFSSSKDTPKGPDFAEPWSAHGPLPFERCPDPLNAIQAIRSHMTSYSSKPVPVEHNSGLLRIFEDYRRVRDAKEHLEVQLQESLKDSKTAEEGWAKQERRYNAEIRCLELLIADEVTGAARALEAGQGGVVDRKRRHQKTISNDGLPPTGTFMTHGQLENEIRLRSRKVFLGRPTSPSGRMVALSGQFARRASVDLRMGTLPTEALTTLSRKAQNELNLVRLGQVDNPQSVPDSVTSGFSAGTGDLLPDEMSASCPTIMDMALECDAFVALRELATLVARRRGLDTEEFNSNLLMLFSPGQSLGLRAESAEIGPLQPKPLEEYESSKMPYINETITSSRTLQRFQFQPQLSSIQPHRRHFSFDPGEDHLQARQDELTPVATKQLHNDSSVSASQVSGGFREPDTRSPLRGLKSSSQVSVSSLDANRPSRIPSPAQPLGRVRRMNSTSSLQSVLTRPSDDRRDSRTSILTAFRENLTGNLQPSTSSRCSSLHNLYIAETSASQKEQPGSVRVRYSAVALAAAGAAGQANQAAILTGGSPKTRSSIGSCSRATHIISSLKLENDDPNKYGEGAASR